MTMRRSLPSVLVLAATLAPAVPAQQAIDSAYTAQIRELTPTDSQWQFTTELVDHLPASETVPTPLEVLRYVPGTEGRLSYVADVNRYFRALADASPRVQLFTLGTSDEGREMLLAAIADEETIGRLDAHREALGRLADPRGLDDAERDSLIREAKPIYWLTGAIHSPETGSPEMLMELAYRLAVGESDWIRTIREGVITLITPVIETDGRDRMVDAYKLSKELGLGPRGVSLVYWGKYTAHDNNRDGMVLSQRLTQQVMGAFLHWKPVVMHDLHESVPFLYASTGTGPYNEEFDPLVVDEWHTLAYQEITELTRRGLPGIWTHGFYDGWTPNYMLAIANFRNSIGRFYETYTSRGADCHTVRLSDNATERRWDRPNPPVNGVRWCIRSNINFQQSGVLIALHYVAEHPETFLTNYAAKARRTIERGRAGPLHAFVIPRGQRRAAEAADLVNLFRAHGSEVHVATADVELRGAKPETRRRRRDRDPADTVQADTVRADSVQVDSVPPVVVRTGDWIVRLDQPYAQLPRTLLARQEYKPDYPNPYDDTGWTMDELRHVETLKVVDPTVLAAPMRLLEQDVTVEGVVRGNAGTLVVRHLGDWRSAVLPWKAAAASVSVADTAFTVADSTYPAGTFVIERADDRVRAAVRELGLTAVGTERVNVRRHAIDLPRVALLHSWIETQNEGWVRYAFDRLGVPYTYISDQDLRSPGALDRFDVVMFPHVRGSLTSLLNGRSMVGPPIPWKTNARTPNLGKLDQTDDIRPGMGLEGAATLRRFVERGGLLVTEGNTGVLPASLGFNPTVSVREPRQLRVRGSVVRAEIADETSPIVYGYERDAFPVYFSREPLFAVQTGTGFGQQDDEDDPLREDRNRVRARIVLKYPSQADSILISGQLENGSEMAGLGAVVDAPVGRGHVVMFGIRPFWRWGTQGSFALALNAMANWNHLTVETETAPAAETAAQ
jgi:hypothetical protein